MRKLQVLLASAVGFFLASSGVSHAMEPFDNWANPPGWYAVAYPVHFSADQLMDNEGNVLLDNLDFSQAGIILRTTYYQAEPSLIFSAYAPLVQVKARHPGTGQEEKVSGLGDVTLVGGWFFIDDKPKHLTVGVGLKVDLPTGDFDKNRAVAQLGEGVWRIRPLLTFAKMAGPFDLEAHLTYKMETENSDTKERDGDEVILESYAGMFLNQKWLAGLHFNAISGQNDEVDGVEIQTSADRVFQAGPSVLVMLNQRSNVILEYLQDFGVKNTVKGKLFLVRGVYKF
jgi:hypothetical protein